MRLSEDLLRQLPELDALSSQLEREPHEFFTRALRREDRRRYVPFEPATAFESAGTLGAMNSENGGEPSLLDELDLDELTRAATRAVNKVRDAGADADISPAEEFALEAIVLLTGRPALFIQNGRLESDLGEWKSLEPKRAKIEATFGSVGRIELAGHPELDWVGTGFLVADSVVMTNRHVAQEFCRKVRGRWKFQLGMSARIDYVEEYGALNAAEFALTSVIGIHETYDLALLRVARTSSQAAIAPAALTVASKAPSSLVGHEVCALGYPAWDGRRNDPLQMQRIFRNRFDVKRCQPGMITVAPQDGVFVHDCSTLGGNSGSCIVDLETYRIIGLHFGGRYLKGNVAVALWELTDDPMLKKADVNWATK